MLTISSATPNRTALNCSWSERERAVQGIEFGDDPSAPEFWRFMNPRSRCWRRRGRCSATDRAGSPPTVSRRRNSAPLCSSRRRFSTCPETRAARPSPGGFPGVHRLDLLAADHAEHDCRGRRSDNSRLLQQLALERRGNFAGIFGNRLGRVVDHGPCFGRQRCGDPAPWPSLARSVVASNAPRARSDPRAARRIGTSPMPRSRSARSGCSPSA